MSTTDSLQRYMDGQTIQVVGFRLGGEEFAVPILTVREIDHVPQVTRMPESPHFVEGITNLRGRVVPVINTAVRFGVSLAEEVSSEARRIVVIDLGATPAAFIVDEVTQIRRIEAACISPAPNARGAADDFIAGIAKLESHLVILLDPSRMVDADELPGGEAAADETADQQLAAAA